MKDLIEYIVCTTLDQRYYIDLNILPVCVCEKLDLDECICLAAEVLNHAICAISIFSNKKADISLYFFENEEVFCPVWVEDNKQQISFFITEEWQPIFDRQICKDGSDERYYIKYAEYPPESKEAFQNKLIRLIPKVSGGITQTKLEFLITIFKAYRMDSDRKHMHNLFLSFSFLFAPTRNIELIRKYLKTDLVTIKNCDIIAEFLLNYINYIRTLQLMRYGFGEKFSLNQYGTAMRKHWSVDNIPQIIYVNEMDIDTFAQAIETSVDTNISIIRDFEKLVNELESHCSETIVNKIKNEKEILLTISREKRKRDNKSKKERREMSRECFEMVNAL